MALATFEGTIENGQIRLRENVKLPEHARVYVVIAEMVLPPQSRIVTTRFANPEDTGRFAKEVVAVSGDAGR